MRPLVSSVLVLMPGLLIGPTGRDLMTKVERRQGAEARATQRLNSHMEMTASANPAVPGLSSALSA